MFKVIKKRLNETVLLSLKPYIYVNINWWVPGPLLSSSREKSNLKRISQDHAREINTSKLTIFFTLSLNVLVTLLIPIPYSSPPSPPIFINKTSNNPIISMFVWTKWIPDQLASEWPRSTVFSKPVIRFSISTVKTLYTDTLSNSKIPYNVHSICTNIPV